MEFSEITMLIWNDKVEEFKALINENPEYYVKLEDGQKKTLLSHAAYSGQLEMVKFLIENGADKDHVDNYNYTTLYLSISGGNYLETTEYLFELGVDVNVLPKYSSNGFVGDLVSNKEASDSLIKKIIDKTNNFTGDILAAVLRRKRIELYKYIIETKSINSTTIVDSLVNLFYSCDKPLAVLDYLFDGNYINANENNRYKQSLLRDIAAQTNDETGVKYLVEKGADLTLNNTGEICLHVMAGRNNLSGVKYLVSQGVNINAKTKENQNALHSECSRYMGYESKKESEIPELLKYLVENGVDLTLVDNYDKKLPIYSLYYNKRTVSVKYVYEKTINDILVKKGIEKDEDLFNALFSIQEVAGNKKEKEILVDAMVEFPQFSDKFVEQINDSKTKLRELAIKSLIKINDNKNLEVLKNRAEVETNKSLLKVLNEYLETKKDSIENMKEEVRNPDDYKKNTPIWFDVVAENENPNIPISWLKVNDLPEVLWKNGKLMELKTVKYFLKLLMDNNVSKMFLNLINSENLINLFDILHVMPSKITKDDLWIYNILFMLAEDDSSCIKLIEDKIQWFVNRSRWAMGAKLLLPMAKIKNIDGLKKVDWYSRKFKHKGIKNDAIYALNNVAREKDLSLDELRDSLISDFGFNKDKELVMDYGTRKIIVKLMPDFKYIFKNEEGKIFKTLPKPNKKDNEKMAKNSIELFKSMKKEIKDILKVQKEKLEYQFKALLLKEFSYWNGFFVKNPILNIFASNLFWGVYENGKLKKIFRYNEDHSFSDINDDEIILKDNDMVGLIHPLELTEKQLNQLKELIDDYEIIQPLEQINRKFFITTSKENELNDFKGFRFYPKSTHYKLLGLGWERGYIVDNGFFESYSMTAKEIGESVNLNFSGVDMYLEYNIDEPVEWHSVIFGYGKGSSLNKVNKRFYSEVYRSLKLVAQTKV